MTATTATPDPQFDLIGRIALVTAVAGAWATRWRAALLNGGPTWWCPAGRLDNCERGRWALAVSVHAANWDSIDALIEAAYGEFGRVDIPVNKAGMSPPMPSREVTEQLFDSVVGLNFKGPFRLAGQVTKGMYDGDRGVIINVSSSASLVPLPGVVPYGSAKAALNQMTRSAASPASSFVSGTLVGVDGGSPAGR